MPPVFLPENVYDLISKELYWSHTSQDLSNGRIITNIQIFSADGIPEDGKMAHIHENFPYIEQNDRIHSSRIESTCGSNLPASSGNWSSLKAPEFSVPPVLPKEKVSRGPLFPLSCFRCKSSFQ